MKKWLVLLALFSSSAAAQETPLVDITWTEGDGAVAVAAADLPHFGQSEGRMEITWTPDIVTVGGPSQIILDIPNHLGIWMYADGVHGQWYTDTGEQRLFRSRWGLTAVGVEIKVVVTWNSSGYAVIIDDVVRIHDWQHIPTTIEPDVDIVDGLYANRIGADAPAHGTFLLQVYDLPQVYDACSVDTVGAINGGPAPDNSTVWDQGIDPVCFLGTGEAVLSWTAPTENEDATPLTDLAGYKIYQGSTSGNYPIEYDVPGAVTTYTVGGLLDGTYYFVATSYNDAGTESVYSNEAVKIVAAPPVIPNPPSGLVVDSDDLLVSYISQSNDVIVLVPVGFAAVGTSCDSSMTVNGKYLVPRDEVTWAGSVEAPTVFASCLLVN